MSTGLNFVTGTAPEDVPVVVDHDSLHRLGELDEPAVPSRTVPVRSETIHHEGARTEYCTHARYDQHSKYPPDPPGEAAGEQGRVWKIYRDRVKDIDEDLLEGWHDTLNMLPVFAGLFSATCTAFLIESSKGLQPDWQQTTSLALLAIYAHLNPTGPPPFEAPNPQRFVAPQGVRLINMLWFTSLALSLAACLLAILAKQWLNEFKSRMRAPASSPKMWAMRHSAFRGGLDRWRVEFIISILPFLLHVALFLFLAGLYRFLFSLDQYVALTVGYIASLLGFLFIMYGLAPVFFPHCPFVTPMTRGIFPILKVMWPVYSVVSSILALFLLPILVLAWLIRDVGIWCFTLGRIRPRFLVHMDSTLFRDFLDRCFPAIRFFPFRAHETSPSRTKKPGASAFDQVQTITSDEPFFEASALAWMIRSLPADDDIQTALGTVGWLSVDSYFYFFAKQRWSNPLMYGDSERRWSNPLEYEDIGRAAVNVLENIAARGDATGKAVVASILRACLFIS